MKLAKIDQKNLNINRLQSSSFIRELKSFVPLQIKCSETFLRTLA